MREYNPNELMCCFLNYSAGFNTNAVRTKNYNASWIALYCVTQGPVLSIASSPSVFEERRNTGTKLLGLISRLPSQFQEEITARQEPGIGCGKRHYTNSLICARYTGETMYKHQATLSKLIALRQTRGNYLKLNPDDPSSGPCFHRGYWGSQFLLGGCETKNELDEKPYDADWKQRPPYMEISRRVSLAPLHRSYSPTPPVSFHALVQTPGLPYELLVDNRSNSRSGLSNDLGCLKQGAPGGY
ncbi:hypothetical protein BDV93DRAFT_508834 [Ceratobasidium sp. AG-I]|nr:hypothetical protein BDV93DRAFT_508834 [Ceratobasidium sp. AG-I]